MATLPTLTLGTYDATGSNDVAIVGTEPVLQSIASAVDTSYVYDTANSTHTGTAWFALSDMPADFLSMLTLTIQFRYFYDTTPTNNTWDLIRAQVFKADKSTVLTDAVSFSPNATTTPQVSLAYGLNNASTTATKSEWDAALVRVLWSISKSKGGDSAEERISAISIEGTYTPTSSNVTRALTGVTSTGAVGTVGVTKSGSAALTGVQATGAVGTVTSSVVVSRALTGVAATGEVGSVGVTQSGSAVLTGTQATGAVGNVTRRVDSTKDLTGVQATGQVGTVTASVGASRALTGVEGTGAVGSVGVTQSGSAALTGTEGTGQIGSVGVTQSGSAALTGTEATGQVGSVTPSVSVSRALTGVEGTGAVGSTGVSVSATRALTGIEATGAVGTVTTGADVTIALTGVQATGQVGTVAFTQSGSAALTGVQATGEVGSVTAGATADSYTNHKGAPGAAGRHHVIVEHRDSPDRDAKPAEQAKTEPKLSQRAKKRAKKQAELEKTLAAAATPEVIADITPQLRARDLANDAFYGEIARFNDAVRIAQQAKLSEMVRQAKIAFDRAKQEADFIAAREAQEYLELLRRKEAELQEEEEMALLMVMLELL